MAMNLISSIALFALTSTAFAQYGPGGNYGGGGDGGNGGSGNPYGGGSGGGSSSGGSGNGGGANGGNGGLDSASQFAGFDIDKAQKIRLAHGVIASAAFVFFLPVGAITIRVIPSKAAIWIHAAFQLFAYVLYIVGFALGLWMAINIKPGGFNMLSSSSTNYHPIIGIILFIVLFFQPILGFVHHLMFKKYQRRRIWSYGHIWLGRVIITLGIINGGLGLKLANNTTSGEIAYGVIAAIIWLVYVAAAVYGEVKRHKAQKVLKAQKAAGKHPGSGSDEEVAGADPAAVNAPAHAAPMEGVSNHSARGIPTDHSSNHSLNGAPSEQPPRYAKSVQGYY